MSRTVRPLAPVGLAPVGLAAVALLGLAACGGGSSDTASDPAAGAASAFTSGTTPGGQMPGAFGTIAAISGKTLQLQNEVTGQVAVSYTGATAITAEVKASRAAVRVGSCVVVSSAGTSSTGTSSTGTSSTGTSSTGTTNTGPVSASAVRISAKTDGACDLRAGGAGGHLGQGGPPDGRSWALGDRPSGAPSGMASDGVRRTGFGTIGEVTAVTSSGFTVAPVRPPAGATTGATPSTGTGTTSVGVTVTGDTTYTTTQKATSAALKVGRCLQATGKTDDTGAVTATSMTVSDPVDGQCAGFMTRGSR